MAIVVGTKTSGNNANGSHTVDAGSNLALIVNVGTHQGTITGVTYGGVAMTQLEVGASTNNENGYIFILLNPTPGAATVAVTRSGGSWHGWSALNLSGVKQTTTVVHAAANGNSSTATVNITPNTDNNLIIGSCGSEAAPSAGATFTLIHALQGQSFENGGSEYFAQGSAALKAVAMGLSSGQRWGMAAVALEPALSTPTRSLLGVGV